MLDDQLAPVPAYLVGFHRDRRELLDIFAQRTTRNELLAAVSAAFAQLAGWDYRAVWGERFRGAPALANVEFLRGYAGCAIPEGLVLAIDLALKTAGGRLTIRELAERADRAAGLDRRVCVSAILRLVWEHVRRSERRAVRAAQHRESQPVKRYVFSRRTRFRFVEQDGSEAGDFEIERRAPNGHVIATSLEHGSPRPSP